MGWHTWQSIVLAVAFGGGLGYLWCAYRSLQWRRRYTRRIEFDALSHAEQMAVLQAFIWLCEKNA